MLHSKDTVNKETEKSMYAYKISNMLAMPSKKLSQMFPTDAAFAKDPGWNGKSEIARVRRICGIRNLILRNLDAFTEFQEDKTSNPTLESNFKTLELKDDGMSLDVFSDIYKEDGCHGITNHINQWMKENIEEILTTIDIPYPRYVAEALFIFPNFISDDQLRCFCELRTKTAQNNDGPVFPRGKILYDNYVNMFNSDKNIYTTIKNIMSADIDVDNLYETTNGTAWSNDKRYCPFIAEEESDQLIEQLFEEVNASTEEVNVKTEDVSVKAGEVRLNEIEVTYNQDMTNLHDHNINDVSIQQPTQQTLLSERKRSSKRVHLISSLRYRVQTRYLDNNIKEFIEKAKCKINPNIMFAIDCDNVNFFGVINLLNILIDNKMTNFLVNLYLDPKSRQMWDCFQNFFMSDNIEINSINVTRIKDEKSSVDIALASDVCKRIYKENFSNVIVFSSDCDYVALIDSIIGSDNIDIAVAFEHAKANNNYIKTLRNKKISLIEMGQYMKDGKDYEKAEIVIKYMLGYTIMCNGISGWNYQVFMEEMASLRDLYRISITNDKLKDLVKRLLSKVCIAGLSESNDLLLAVDDYEFN